MKVPESSPLGITFLERILLLISGALTRPSARRAFSPRTPPTARSELVGGVPPLRAQAFANY